jgi:hypothetical protein
MFKLRTYPIEINEERSEMPRTLFDERWNDPLIVSKVALEMFRNGAFPDGDAAKQRLLDAGTLPDYPAAKTDARTCTLEHVHALRDLRVRFKGGAINELHRRYAFGAKEPTANFHAKIICFGADSAGRFFARATVGRWGGVQDNEAALVARFLAGEQVIGGVVWRGSFPTSAADTEVLLRGSDPRLASAFDGLNAVNISFYARQLGAAEKAVVKEAPGLDEALAMFGS